MLHIVRQKTHIAFYINLSVLFKVFQGSHCPYFCIQKKSNVIKKKKIPFLSTELKMTSNEVTDQRAVRDCANPLVTQATQRQGTLCSPSPA